MNIKNILQQYTDVRYVKSDNPQWNLKDCPFCDSGNWKVYLGVKSHMWDCKKCGEAGGERRLIQEFTGEDEYSLIEDETPLNDVGEGQDVQKPQEWFLPASDLATDHKYLLNRGIGNDIIEKFNLRICNHGTFANRIIFPFYDENGKLAGYQGRDITGAADNKYLFPTNIKKSNLLYNYHNCSKNARALFIVEGVTDVYPYINIGYPNVVATFGKTLSDYQLELIRRLNPKRIFIGWDLDALKQTIKTCDDIEHIAELRVIELGDNDADEISKEELTGLVSSANIYNKMEMLKSLLKLNNEVK